MDKQDRIGCVNNSIKLTTGGFIDLIKPDPNDINIIDIATSLSRTARYTGHGTHFYSVAEHSVLGTRRALADGNPIPMCQAFLLHDAPEAFIGDVAKPLKVLLPEYRKFEDAFEAAVSKAFDVDLEGWHSDIKYYDLGMLKAEKQAMWGKFDQWSGLDQVDNLDVKLEFWSPAYARNEFLALFYQLFA